MEMSHERVADVAHDAFADVALRYPCHPPIARPEQRAGDHAGDVAHERAGVVLRNRTVDDVQREERRQQAERARHADAEQRRAPLALRTARSSARPGADRRAAVSRARSVRNFGRGVSRKDSNRACRAVRFFAVLAPRALRGRMPSLFTGCSSRRSG